MLIHTVSTNSGGGLQHINQKTSSTNLILSPKNAQQPENKQQPSARGEHHQTATYSYLLPQSRKQAPTKGSTATGSNMMPPQPQTALSGKRQSVPNPSSLKQKNQLQNGVLKGTGRQITPTSSEQMISANRNYCEKQMLANTLATANNNSSSQFILHSLSGNGQVHTFEITANSSQMPQFGGPSSNDGLSGGRIFSSQQQRSITPATRTQDHLGSQDSGGGCASAGLGLASITPPTRLYTKQILRNQLGCSERIAANKEQSSGDLKALGGGGGAGSEGRPSLQQLFKSSQYSNLAPATTNGHGRLPLGALVDNPLGAGNGYHTGSFDDPQRKVGINQGQRVLQKQAVANALLRKESQSGQYQLLNLNSGAPPNVPAVNKKRLTQESPLKGCGNELSSDIYKNIQGKTHQKSTAQLERSASSTSMTKGGGGVAVTPHTLMVNENQHNHGQASKPTEASARKPPHKGGLIGGGLTKESREGHSHMRQVMFQYSSPSPPPQGSLLLPIGSEEGLGLGTVQQNLNLINTTHWSQQNLLMPSSTADAKASAMQRTIEGGVLYQPNSILQANNRLILLKKEQIQRGVKGNSTLLENNNNNTTLKQYSLEQSDILPQSNCFFTSKILVSDNNGGSSSPYQNNNVQTLIDGSSGYGYQNFQTMSSNNAFSGGQYGHTMSSSAFDDQVTSYGNHSSSKLKPIQRDQSDQQIMYTTTSDLLQKDFSKDSFQGVGGGGTTATAAALQSFHQVIVTEGAMRQSADIGAKGKGVLANTLKSSVLQPSSKIAEQIAGTSMGGLGGDKHRKQQSSNMVKKSGTGNDPMSPVNRIPNNSAVYKQTQLYKQLQLQQQQQQQQQQASLRGKLTNKRVVLAAGSSHFRHSSSTVKKQLLAQAASGGGGISVAPVPSTSVAGGPSSSNNNQRNNFIILNNLPGGSVVGSTVAGDIKELNKLRGHIQTSEPFQYKMVPSISYESKGVVNGIGDVQTPVRPIHSKGSISQFTQMNSAAAVAGKKFGKLYGKAAKGIDEFNKEIQTIIEKEKLLTEEIIKNSLVKQNGRFNFEALAHLNDIMESKKNIKKRFGVEGLSLIPKQTEQACLFIQSYGEKLKGFDNDEDTDPEGIASSTIQELENAAALALSVTNKSDQRALIKQGAKRISDYFLKGHYLGQNSLLKGANSVDDRSPMDLENDGSPMTLLSTMKQGSEEYQRLLQIINNSQASITNRAAGGASGLSNGGVGSPPPHVKKPKKTSKNASKYKPNIKIYHVEDASLKHIQEHPINKAIQKINYIIRLIFKYQNSSMYKGDSGGTSSYPQQNFDSVKGNSNGSSGNQPIGGGLSLGGQQTSLQQHLIEEQRIIEIQRVASKWFGIQVPLKRLESKAALREYFQSREFTVALRSKMNSMIYTAVNKSNKILDLVAQMQAAQLNSGLSFYRFYVGWGNNDAIVRSVLKQRSQWQQNNNEDFNEVSFMWTQWKKQSHIDYLGGGNNTMLHSMSNTQRSIEEQQAQPQKQEPESSPKKVLNPPRINSLEKGIKIYNRIEQNKQLTNKKGVFLNMREYYYMIGQDPFDVLPLTFLIYPGRSSGDQDFQRFQLYFQDIANQIRRNEKNRTHELEQRTKEIKQELQKKKKEETDQQSKNNVILSQQQKRKQTGVFNQQRLSQWRNKRSRAQNYDSYDDGDQTESDETWDEEWSRRMEEENRAIENDEKIKEIKKKYPDQKNIWIVKPGENTNRGNGINVCSDLNEIRSLVQHSRDPGSQQESTFIIQRYIDNPLLIYGRKFDFRCYGFMSSINGHLKGYFYEDAYIRTSCKEFDIYDVHNKFIHLTNDAVQKFSQDYGKYENGNKLSMQDFQKYLKQVHPHLNIDVWRDIMPQIRKLVTDSYRSVYGKIDPGRLHNTFELFGYDFMIDADFRLYLIEVNTNPCLEMTCPLLARIIPEVLDNTFRLVLDPLFPQPEMFNNRKSAMIPQEIKYTLVFDEDIDGAQLKKLKSDLNGGGQTQNIAIIDEIESDQEDDLREGEDCTGAKCTSSVGVKSPNTAAGIQKSPLKGQ